MRTSALPRVKCSLLFLFMISTLGMLGILSLSRLFLMVWQSDRLTEIEWWITILINGLRVDISSLCYLFILPTLLLVLFGGQSRFSRFCVYIYRVWFVLGLWLIVYMEIATPNFIAEYDVRPNRLFIEYLKYPEEVFSMLWVGYRGEVLLGTFVSLIVLYLGWNLSCHMMQSVSFPHWKWRPFVATVVLAIGVLGARGTLQHRPLNPALVAFTDTPLINDLALNSSYSMLYAVYSMAKEEDAFNYYPKMSESEVIQEIQNMFVSPNLIEGASGLPLLSFHKASVQTHKPKNLVILLQESLGARYVGALGGMPLTPNLDKLIEQGWAFEQMYATGTRSVRGIEAVISGFPPTPAVSVVKQPKSQSHFFTIADVLKQNNYVTQFIYGGESHFDNMKSFFLNNGFTNIQDLPSFESPKFVGSWGACDEDLYQKAHQQFSLLNQSDKPFFSLVFTSSNHSPFEFPKNTIDLYNEPAATRENAVKYSDYALGNFFKLAKQSSYWEDTIFLIVADHDSRAYGDQPVPIEHYHIPAVFIGNGIEAKKDQRLASQLDLPVTMLSLIGISSVTPMQGYDLTQAVPESKQRAIMQFNNNFAWMDSNHNVAILQPQREPRGYHYNSNDHSLKIAPLDQAVLKKANAHALWGSLAYQKGYFRAVEQAQYMDLSK